MFTVYNLAKLVADRREGTVTEHCGDLVQGRNLSGGLNDVERIGVR